MEKGLVWIWIEIGMMRATAGLLPCFLRDTHIPAVLTWTCECAPDKYEWSQRANPDDWE